MRVKHRILLYLKTGTIELKIQRVDCKTSGQQKATSRLLVNRERTARVPHGQRVWMRPCAVPPGLVPISQFTQDLRPRLYRRSAAEIWRILLHRFLGRDRFRPALEHSNTPRSLITLNFLL